MKGIILPQIVETVANTAKQKAKCKQRKLTEQKFLVLISVNKIYSYSYLYILHTQAEELISAL